MEYLATYQLAGLLIGLAAGALAAQRGWDTVPAVVGALAGFVLVLLVPDLVQGHGLSAVMGAMAMGPVVGIVPVAAGFFAGRWAATRLKQRHRRSRKSGNP
jgi:hypothetical protein